MTDEAPNLKARTRAALVDATADYNMTALARTALGPGASRHQVEGLRTRWRTMMSRGWPSRPGDLELLACALGLEVVLELRVTAKAGPS